MNLPQKLTLEQMQPKWASIINPVLENPILKGQMVEVPLIVGLNQVNHGLQRNWIGWFVVNIDGAATLYVNPNQNQTPLLTVPITSDAVVTVSLWIF